MRVSWLIFPFCISLAAQNSAQPTLNFAGDTGIQPFRILLKGAGGVVVGSTSYGGSGPEMIQVASFGGAYPSTQIPLEQASDAARTGIDTPMDAAFDSAGNLWVVGSTTSDDFFLLNPIVSKKVPYRMTGFVAEIDPRGTIKFASYLGGQHPCQYSCSSYASAVTTDSAGNVYVAGTTDESDFPATPGAYLTTGPNIDSRGNTYFYTFLLKISASGNLVYGTFLGTGQQKCLLNPCFGEISTSSRVDSLAVDNSGAVTAAESMSEGPGRITHLSPDGLKAIWTADTDITIGGITKLLLAQDAAGDVKLFGAAAPLLDPLDARAGNGPATLFVEQVSSVGSVTSMAMLGGASGDAQPSGIALDSSGNIWLDGTDSSTSGALFGGAGSGSDFLLEVGPSFNPVGLLRFPHGVIAAGLVIDTAQDKLIPGPNSALLTVPAGYSPSTPLLAGFMNSASFAVNMGAYPGALVSLIGIGFHGDAETVNIAGVAVPVLYAGPSQINLQIPFEADSGVVNLSIPSEGISIHLPITRSLGIFTTDGVHAAAVNQDGTVNSALNPAPMGSVVTIYGTGAVWPYGMRDGAIPTGAAWLNPEQNGFQIVDLPARIPQEILYAGAAPERINGVFQVNVMVPAGVVVTANGWQVQLNSVLQTSNILSSNYVGIYVH